MLRLACFPRVQCGDCIHAFSGVRVFFFSLVARLSMKQVRILQLDEDVLCVRYSPNQKLLAVSLLDCTVKVFYTDTLKVCDCMDCEALIIIAWKMRSMLENCTFIVGFQ